MVIKNNMKKQALYQNKNALPEYLKCNTNIYVHSHKLTQT